MEKGVRELYLAMKACIPGYIQERGQAYADEERVQITQITPESLKATVMGDGGTYRVVIDRSDFWQSRVTVLMRICVSTWRQLIFTPILRLSLNNSRRSSFRQMK